MKKLQWAGVFCLAAAVALAQDAPRVEVFGGYTYTRVNVDLAPTLSQGFNFNGGSGQLTVNANRWLGLVADFGGGRTNTTIRFGSVTEKVEGNIFSYLFGPRVWLSGNTRLRPYAQVLFGGARFSDQSERK